MTPLRSLPFLLALLVVPACARPVPKLPGPPPQRTAPWDPALVETMASLPLQEGGRVKPFSTLAAFTLYFVHGRRDVKFGWTDAGGEHKVVLEPTEWLLDVWCFPEQAADYPLFRIENTGVLDALGIGNDGQTQDFEYLSYRRLMTHSRRLGELAEQYRKIEARDRSPVQDHIVQSYAQLATYHTLHRQLAALHETFPLQGDELRAALGGAETVTLGGLVEHSKPFRELVISARGDLASSRLGNTASLLEKIELVVGGDGGPALFPPVGGARVDAWLPLGEVIDQALRGTGQPQHAAMVVALQTAIAAKDVGARDAALRAFRAAVVPVASAHPEAGTVELETYYYRASWHYQSIHWFLLGFVLAAVGWLLPRNKVIWWASVSVTTVALGMLSYDVALRCMITGRPPIKNLYDTFLFIAGTGVLVALVAEFVLPRRIALALAPLLGAVVVMFARLFEVTKGEDTMAPLGAVLDSNFWLATHVTTINIGYAAGLVAAVFANAWVLVRVLRIAHPSAPLSKSLVRMTYGVTCFSLIFSVVGTILGGVWANDSWGRFWGWDPKENGALMICLSQIALLHARMSGLVRDFGFIVWSCITGMVVLFSWFHVNLLGVGLHNYGFSSGLATAVWTGYGVEVAFLLVGALDVLLRPVPAHDVAAAGTRAALAGAE